MGKLIPNAKDNTRERDCLLFLLSETSETSALRFPSLRKRRESLSRKVQGARKKLTKSHNYAFI